MATKAYLGYFRDDLEYQATDFEAVWWALGAIDSPQRDIGAWEVSPILRTVLGTQ